MQKIVFIGGFFGTKFDHIVFKKIMKNYKIICFQYNTKLIDSIPNIAKDLDKFIKSLKLENKEKINMIGLSAGGIIADYYLKFINNEKINKFVTIFSPFKGSILTYLFPKKFKGLNNLKNNSEILKKLNKQKLQNIEIISFWSFLDPIVFGISGKYKNSKHTLFCIHSFIQFWPVISIKIKKFFD